MGILLVPISEQVHGICRDSVFNHRVQGNDEQAAGQNWSVEYAAVCVIIV